jgi:hypothetical protein
LTKKFPLKKDVTPKPDGKKSGSKFPSNFDSVLFGYLSAVWFTGLIADTITVQNNMLLAQPN